MNMSVCVFWLFVFVVLFLWRRIFLENPLWNVLFKLFKLKYWQLLAHDFFTFRPLAAVILVIDFLLDEDAYTRERESSKDVEGNVECIKTLRFYYSQMNVDFIFLKTRLLHRLRVADLLFRNPNVSFLHFLSLFFLTNEDYRFLCI